MITVTATDLDGLSDVSVFDVTVPDTNAGPVTNGAIPDQQFEQGLLITPIDTSAIFTDPEVDTLTFSVDQLPDGLALDPATGEISGTPLTVEIVAVTVSATDAGTGGSNTTTDAAAFDIEITAPPVVVPANVPPMAAATALPDISVTAGAVFVPLDVGPLFSDADGDALTFSVDQLPAGLTLDAVTGLISGTPTATVVEQVQVTVSATDAAVPGSNTTVDAIPFEIEVLPAPVANVPPVAAATALPDVSVAAGTLFSLDVRLLFTDAENDVLTFSVDMLPVGLALDAVSGFIEGSPTSPVPEQVQVTVSATDTLGSNTTVDALPFEIAVL